MKLRGLCLALVTLTFPVASASAQGANIEVAPDVSLPPVTIDPGDTLDINLPTWKCRRGDGAACSRVDLASQAHRQILVMPSGSMDTPQDKRAFWDEFDRLVSLMSSSGNAWSSQKKDRLHYVGYFVPGGALGTPTAAFGGKVAPHLLRGFALSSSNEAVAAKVDSLRSTVLPELRPMGVALLLNDFQDDITPNAAPPSFTGRPYGIARINRKQLESGYIATHELAHAALNFLDEYTEPGFEALSIRALDVVTLRLSPDGSWGGLTNAISDLLNVYDYNMSEILAGNGNHNISLSSFPSTVYSPISGPERHIYEGGMLFGRGTYHGAGKNLMGSDRAPRGPDDGFAYAHSAGQQDVIETAFGGAARRANDRLRNAGPRGGWPLAQGSQTTVMLYDADKNHRFQPTQSYAVQAGYWDRRWSVCWQGPVPYPCSTDTWRVAERRVPSQRRTMSVSAGQLGGLADLVQRVLCANGVTEIPKPDRSPFLLCEQPLSSISSAFLPTFTFHTPYEVTTVPASQWFTPYWWRFSTHNGTTSSGWTGWSSFYRSL